jgi:hypothetical protein
MAIKRDTQEGPVALTVSPDDVAIHFTDDGTTIYMPEYVNFGDEPPKQLPDHVRTAIMHLIALEHPEAMEDFIKAMWEAIGSNLCGCGECVAQRAADTGDDIHAALTAITIANNDPGEA